MRPMAGRSRGARSDGLQPPGTDLSVTSLPKGTEYDERLPVATSRAGWQLASRGQLIRRWTPCSFQCSRRLGTPSAMRLPPYPRRSPFSVELRPATPPRSDHRPGNRDQVNSGLISSSSTTSSISSGEGRSAKRWAASNTFGSRWMSAGVIRKTRESPSTQ